MKVYVVLERNGGIPRVFGSIKAVSDDLEIPYYRLWRVFGFKGEDIYSEWGVEVHRVLLRRSLRAKKNASKASP